MYVKVALDSMLSETIDLQICHSKEVVRFNIVVLQKSFNIDRECQTTFNGGLVNYFPARGGQCAECN